MSVIVLRHSTKDVCFFIKNYLEYEPTIVEAGAYRGKDTISFASFWPHGVVHAFEPIPHIFVSLKKNTSKYNNVFCYNMALSDDVATRVCYSADYIHKERTFCPASSLLKPKDRLKFSPVVYPRSINVLATTLDAWAESHNIDSIDFLWLDVQGHELAVMKASPRMMKTVRVLRCEVNFVQAYHQQPPYKEVYSWLSAQGFDEIARDFADKTTWFFGNSIFVRR